MTRVRIQAPRFTGFVVFADGEPGERICTDADEVLKLFIGSGRMGVEGYCRVRRWTFEEVN